MVKRGTYKNFNESRRPTFDTIVGVVLCKLMMTLQILEVRLGSTNTSQNLETSLNRRLEGNVQGAHFLLDIKAILTKEL